MPGNEKLRVDKYLWAIRIFKTRSLSADACNNGKVKSNGTSLKPSKSVSIGDRYTIKTEARKWVIEVTGLLDHRVQYSEAVKYYLDLTPEEDVLQQQSSSFVFNTGKRKSKKGRPTKKDKRDLDDLFE